MTKVTVEKANVTLHSNVHRTVVNLQMQGVQPTQWGREEMPAEAVLTGNA